MIVRRRRLFERGLFDQDTLPLVALSRTTEAHHDCTQPARLFGATAECRVTSWQIDQMVQFRAVPAQRTGVIHQQKITSPAALAAGPVGKRRDHYKVGSTALSFRQPFLFGHGKLGRNPMGTVGPLDRQSTTLAEA